MNLVLGMFLLFVLLGAIKQFARLDPARVARAVRQGGGAIGLVAALLLVLRGSVNLAAALAGLAAALSGRRPAAGGWTSFRTGGTGQASHRVSTARSAMLEMRLDHATGAMSGVVLGGVYAGRLLNDLARPDLASLRAELARDDPDGLSLLEAYLDRRFAGWREADEGEAQRRRSAGGAMSRREAYEILGLPEGAAAAEIIRAHRALMKKFHPDHGGSTALAARVNQAKDVLLQRHG